MDFHEGGRFPPAILVNAVARWEEVLGDLADEQVQRVFAAISQQAKAWSASSTSRSVPDVNVIFGGGEKPLWRQLVDAWPKGEPVLRWHICSPFWPQVDRNAARNPFEAIAQALADQGSSLTDCDLEIITRADTPGPNAIPRFPFSLIIHLREHGFPVRKGRILPARLDPATEEIPTGMACENRDLHAKWIVLAGPVTAIALVGSANFTRQGLGVLRDPNTANIEAGVLMRWPRGKWDPREWRPPLQGQELDWETCEATNLCEPLSEEEKVSDWPAFIHRIELNIRWENLPEPDGKLNVCFRVGDVPDFSIGFPSLSEPNPKPSLDVKHVIATRPFVAPISADQVRAILTRRVVDVIWANGAHRSLFPVNILHESKAGMPSILGARPSEEQLLEYFHGRISEEDLLSRLEQKAREGREGDPPTDQVDIERIRRLQSYIVREFVEGLYGLARMIREASYSPRAAEQALLGDFSPVSLAEQILQAFTAGKRSPAAAAFQIVELIRVVADLDWPTTATVSSEMQEALEQVRCRAIDRLFAFAAQANMKTEFIEVLMDREFAEFVRAMLPSPLFRRWAAMEQAAEQVTSTMQEEVTA
jgi:hypothetical protein